MADKDRVMTFDSVFLNSKSVFVEYADLVRPIYITILKTLSVGEPIKEYPNFTLNFSEIIGMSDEELDDWYVTRPYKNLLMNFVLVEDMDNVRMNDLEMILNKNIELVPEILKIATPLSVVQALKILFGTDNGLSKKAIIWYPYHNKAILEDIRELFSDISQFVEVKMGPIESALAEVPDDSTYIFSDITNVGVLEDVGKLDYSSIIVAEEYGYNVEDGEFIVDIDKLKEKHIFKFDRFFATESASL
jgi:hypothetical protein